MENETYESLGAQIEAIKEQRGQRWRDLLPADVNDQGVERAQQLAREAEQHPDVLAYDRQMAELRARQFALGAPVKEAE